MRPKIVNYATLCDFYFVCILMQKLELNFLRFTITLSSCISSDILKKFTAKFCYRYDNILQKIQLKNTLIYVTPTVCKLPCTDCMHASARAKIYRPCQAGPVPVSGPKSNAVGAHLARTLLSPHRPSHTTAVAI